MLTVSRAAAVPSPSSVNDLLAADPDSESSSPASLSSSSEIDDILVRLVTDDITDRCDADTLFKLLPDTVAAAIDAEDDAAAADTKLPNETLCEDCMGGGRDCLIDGRAGTNAAAGRCISVPSPPSSSPSALAVSLMQFKLGAANIELTNSAAIPLPSAAEARRLPRRPSRLFFDPFDERDSLPTEELAYSDNSDSDSLNDRPICRSSRDLRREIRARTLRDVLPMCCIRRLNTEALFWPRPSS